MDKKNTIETKEINFFEKNNFKECEMEIRERLINIFKMNIENFIKENSRLPSVREWDQNKMKPTRLTLREKMNTTVNKLLVEFGYLEKEKLKKDYMKEEMIEAIKRFKIEKGRNPIVNDFKADRLIYMPSISQIYRYFNGLEDMLLNAGLEKNYKGRKKSEILESLDRFIKENNRLPTQKDLMGSNRNVNYPEYRAFVKLGGIYSAFFMLGYDEDEEKRLLNNISGEEYEKNLKHIILKHKKLYNEVPGSKEWDILGYRPSRKSIEKKYGMSFNNVLVKFEYNPKYKTPNRYTDEEILIMLKVYADEIDRTPTFEEFKKNQELPHPKVFIDHFGSYEKAVEKAGLSSNKVYEKEFLISEIYRFIDEFKNIPAANVFRAMQGYPSTKAYKRVFGSFTECIVKLGLTPVGCQVKNAYSKKVISLDLDVCNSAEEAFVDDYLYQNDIKHIREKVYPYHEKYNMNGKKKYDFLIEVNKKKVYIEYAGLIGKEVYFNKIQEKIKLCIELELNLIIIYPWNLGSLDKVIKQGLEKISASKEALIIGE